MKTPKIDIIIPAAGRGRRLRSNGVKALLQVDGESVIERQIRILKSVFPKSRIIVVVGYESAQLKAALPKYVKIVENRSYQFTNVAKSIQLGLEITSPRRSALIVYSDLVFNRSAIEDIPIGKSSVVLTHEPGRENEVGVNVVNGKATHFSYGLNNKWAQIVMLAPKEKQLFLKASSKPSAGRLFGYEILNSVIDSGGTLFTITNPLLKLVEIDTIKDFASLTSSLSYDKM